MPPTSKRPYNFTALPLLTSPPILFQYRQTADLLAGSYEFVPGKYAFTPDRELNVSAMYWFRTLTVSADVGESDYAGAIASIPTLSLFLQQSAQGPFLREAVQIGKYFTNLPYEKCFTIHSSSTPAAVANAPEAIKGFTGSISGTITQTAALLGKESITLTVLIAAQEIMDDGFNRSLRKGFDQ